MSEYLVTWEIDIEADSPEEAAQKARAAQIRTGTEALVFTVADKADPADRLYEVDLLDDTIREVA